LRLKLRSNAQLRKPRSKKSTRSKRLSMTAGSRSISEMGRPRPRTKEKQQKSIGAKEGKKGKMQWPVWGGEALEQLFV